MRRGGTPEKGASFAGPGVGFLSGVFEFVGREGGKKLELFSFYDAFEIPSASREIKYCSF